MAPLKSRAWSADGGRVTRSPFLSSSSRVAESDVARNTYVGSDRDFQIRWFALDFAGIRRSVVRIVKLGRGNLVLQLVTESDVARTPDQIAFFISIRLHWPLETRKVRISNLGLLDLYQSRGAVDHAVSDIRHCVTNRW